MAGFFDGYTGSMNTQKILHTADHISTWVGKAAAWLIVVLMLVVCASSK